MSFSLDKYISYEKSKKLLMGFYAFAFGALFYSAGNFGFLNLFNFRREFQAIIIVMFIPLYLLVIEKFMTLLKEPLFLLTLVMLFGELFFRGNLIHLADALLSVFIVGILFSLKNKNTNDILKWIIIFCAFFSIMAIIQAIIIWIHPGILKFFSSRYGSWTSAGFVKVGHPLEYLGFVDHDRGYFLFGHYFYRLHSFTSEPSVIVCSFLLPGLLALTYKNGIRFLAVPILFFSIILASSGTVWLSVLLGFLALPFFLLFGRRINLLSIIPFIVILLFLSYLVKIDASQLSRKILKTLSPIQKINSEIKHKKGSLTARLEGIQEYTHLVKKYPFGMPFVKTPIGGLLFTFTHNGGILALLLGIIVSCRIFKYCAQCFIQNRRSYIRISSVFVYGLFTQCLVFFSGGWDNFVGIMIISLTYLRFEWLVDQSGKERQAAISGIIKVIKQGMKKQIGVNGEAVSFKM